MRLATTLLLPAAISLAALACAQDMTKEKPKRYIHRIDAGVAVKEDNATLAGTKATCTVTFNVHDKGGMSGAQNDRQASEKLPAFDMVATGASGTAGSSGSGTGKLDEDTKCHVENPATASLVSVSCEFERAGGNYKLEYVTDPQGKQHLDLTKGLKGEDRDGWVPAKNVPKETYTGTDGKQHAAPPFTGKYQVWKGAGGSITGSGKGSASMDVTFMVSGRACAANEP